MSALTSIFNFLYVYLRCLLCFFTSSLFDVRHFNVPEQKEIARQMIITASNGSLQNGIEFDFSAPILFLIVGIFAVGSIIGLIRRLTR